MIMAGLPARVQVGPVKLVRSYMYSPQNLPMPLAAKAENFLYGKILKKRRRDDNGIKEKDIVTVKQYVTDKKDTKSQLFSILKSLTG